MLEYFFADNSHLRHMVDRDKINPDSFVQHAILSAGIRLCNYDCSQGARWQSSPVSPEPQIQKLPLTHVPVEAHVI
jgi:hypothetical protein